MTGKLIRTEHNEANKGAAGPTAKRGGYALTFSSLVAD
jgi:hypothetical protein